jgi:hypothetical protein
MLKQFYGWVNRVDKYWLVSGQVVGLCTATRRWLVSHTQTGSFKHCLVAVFTTAFPPSFFQNFIRYFNSYTLHPQDL